VYPYFPAPGPGAGLGGAGVALGTPALSSGAIYAGLVLGNQLSPFRSAVPGPIAQSDLAAVASLQATEIGSRISLGSLQQSVVTNQFNASDLREGWVGAYVGLAGRARELALSLCGRIP
jgi:hypothetical protein